MFASLLERFDLLMTLVACGLVLWEGFLGRTGIREIKNQRKKTDGRNEKYFLRHRGTSQEGDSYFVLIFILLQRWGKAKKNYLHPRRRIKMVHPKRMIKKIINCLTSLGSISPPFSSMTGDNLYFLSKLIIRFHRGSL
jgi:hypothetical protein